MSEENKKAIEESEKEEIEGYKEVMEEANKIRNSNVGVNSTTEALLVMIYQSIDTIRYNSG